MSPLERGRRRPSAAAVVIGLVALLLVGVLVGGALEVPSVSGPYRRAVNRSYADQGADLIEASNAQGRRLTALMGDMASMGRAALQTSLDTLVRSTGSTALQADGLAPPTPTGGLGARFATVLSDRAQATASVRSAVYGLLGMAPLPQAGAPATSGAVNANNGTPRLSPAVATARLTAAGAQLTGADADYASVRRGFLVAPGSARLPSSRWVTDPRRWAPGPLSTLVGALTSSSTLSPVVKVVVVPNTLNLTPPAVPAASGASPTSAPATATTGVTTVPPTRTITVSVVVVNEGNVTAQGVKVSGQAVPEDGGAPSSSSTSLTLAALASTSVTLPPLAVDPGMTYHLAVAVTPPAAQGDRSGLSETVVVRVAPGPPPTTTTTTTVPPRTTTTAPRAAVHRRP